MTTSAALVTGARGKTGRAVVRLLSDRPDLTIRAGTSRPVEPRSTEVASVRPVAFDWSAPGTWREATRGVDRVYLVRPDLPDAPDLVGRFVELVPDAHIVLLSEQGAGELPEDHWAQRVERGVTERASSWTVLRPSWFQQVLTDPRFYLDAIRDDGTIGMPSGPVAWVDARDIAAVAVAALLDPDAHRARTPTVTGPEALTAGAVADLVAAAAGRPVRRVDPVDASEVADSWVDGIVADLHRRVRTGGFAAVTSTVEEVAGRPPRTMQAFVDEHRHLWRPAGRRETSASPASDGQAASVSRTDA